MLQRATSIHFNLYLERVVLNLNIHQKEERNIRHIDFILTHPIKTEQPHSNLESPIGFEILCKPIMDHLDHTTNHPKTTKSHVDPQNWIWTGRFELDIPQKGQEGKLDG